MLQFDLFLIGGLVIFVLALPAIASAVTDRRSPRVAAVVLILAGGMIAYAVAMKPGGYSISDVPDAAMRVVAYFIR
jgi:hypothetical protein